MANGVESGGTGRAATYHVALAVRSDAFAGVERYISLVAQQLGALGHRVTVIGGDTARMAAAAPNAKLVPAASTLAVALALARHARRADVVHVHMTAAEAAALVTRPLLRGVVVSTLHFASPRGSSVAGFAMRPLIRRGLDRQIAISEFVCATAHERAVVILNGVPNCDAVDATTHRVLIAQRLEAEKHTAEALRAWALTGLAAEGWELCVAGDGSERAMLEKLVADERIANVQFLGRRDDLRELRRETAMQLATARADGFGLSVAEAMAVALPVVAADGGGHRETVGACRPDLLYPPGDVHGCAAIMRRLADDMELRRRVGRELQASQRAHLSDVKHVDALVAQYDELVGVR